MTQRKRLYGIFVDGVHCTCINAINGKLAIKKAKRVCDFYAKPVNKKGEYKQ